MHLKKLCFQKVCAVGGRLPLEHRDEKRSDGNDDRDDAKCVCGHCSHLLFQISWRTRVKKSRARGFSGSPSTPYSTLRRHRSLRSDGGVVDHDYSFRQTGPSPTRRGVRGVPGSGRGGRLMGVVVGVKWFDGHKTSANVPNAISVSPQSHTPSSVESCVPGECGVLVRLDLRLSESDFHRLGDSRSRVRYYLLMADELSGLG